MKSTDTAVQEYIETLELENRLLREELEQWKSLCMDYSEHTDSLI